MLKSLKISILLAKINLKSLKRYRTNSLLDFFIKQYGFNFATDWIGLVLFFSIFSTIFIGISFEKPIIFEGSSWVNIVNLNIFLFLIIMGIEFLMLKNSFDINFFILKIYSISYKKINLIKYFYNIFDKKIIVLFLYEIILCLFLYYYNANVLSLIFITFLTLFITYLLTCSMIVLLKNLFNKFIQEASKIFLSILLSVLFILIFLYIHYVNIITIPLSYIIIYLYVGSLLNILLFFINLNLEKNTEWFG